MTRETNLSRHCNDVKENFESIFLSKENDQQNVQSINDQEQILEIANRETNVVNHHEISSLFCSKFIILTACAKIVKKKIIHL